MSIPSWTRKPWAIVVLIIITLALIGAIVGGGDDPAPAAQPTPTATERGDSKPAEPTPEPSPTETATECMTVPDTVAANLAKSMGDGDVTKAAAVKSTIADTYVVVIELTSGGFENDRATFEVASIEQASSTRAIDGFAKQFTNFPDSAYSIADEDVKAAHACLT